MSSNTAFQRLINNLPPYFALGDSGPAAGIALHYSGTNAICTITNRALTTLVNGGSGVNLTVALTSYTLQTLVTFLNTQTGYTATLVGTAGIPAISLLEVNAIDIVTTSASLFIFTSLLYCILMPIAWAFEDLHTTLNSMLDELLLNVADGQWVDAWGDMYGALKRNAGENDEAFALRIIAEVTRNRLGARAIEDAVRALSFININVSSGQFDVVKIVGRTFLGQNIFTDRQHALNQFVVYGLDQDVSNNQIVKSIVNQNRAAGENPLYSYMTPPFEVTFVSNSLPAVAPWPSN